MNHLDPIEKRFKDGLEAYQDVAPSSGLYRRIERSLLRRRLAKMFNKKRLLILLALLLGVVWTAHSILSQEQRHRLATRKSSYIHHSQKIQKFSIASASANISTATETPEPVKAQEVSPSRPAATDRSVRTTQPGNNIGKTTGNLAPASTLTSTSSSTMPVAKAASVQTTKAKPAGAVTTHKQQQVFLPHFMQLRTMDLLSSGEDVLAIKDHKNKYPFLRPRFYTEVFVGMALAQSSLSVSDPDWNKHLEFHQNNEKSLATPLLGVDIKYFKKNYFVQTGLRHFMISDHMAFEMDVLQIRNVESYMRIVEEIFVDSIVSYIHTPIDSLPVYQSVLDTTIITETVTNYIDSSMVAEDFRVTNTISYIEIPLMVGYQYQWKAWYVDLALGASYSRLMQQQFRYPDKELTNLVDYSQQSSVIRKHMFAAQVAVGLGYQFSPQTSIFIRPSYHYQLQSVFDNSYPLRKEYQQVRFAAGLRFKM